MAAARLGTPACLASRAARPAVATRAAVCMAKKFKNIRVVVTLECTEQKESGVPGMSRYTTMKNRRNTPDRLEIKVQQVPAPHDPAQGDQEIIAPLEDRCGSVSSTCT